MARERRVSPANETADLPEDWTPRARNLAQIRELVERLPLHPGVYLMRDRKGRVVYVGKAKKLRNRVRQYFNGHDTRYFVPRLSKIVGDIETLVTNNDKEAMLLENELIKRHHPRFNVKLRDDKQYLVLRLDPRSKWPRLEVVRNIAFDGAHYHGPYHSASRARHTLRVVNRHFKLRTCSDHVLAHRKRPCLQYQIDRCPAPCVFDVDEESYAAQVKAVHLFLAGRHKELVGGLHDRMQSASAAEDFESAARLRDQLRSVETSLESQRIVGTGDVDQDVFGLYREGGQVELAVMHIRGGKLLGSQIHSEKGMELPDQEVLASFVAAYYDQTPVVPAEILLPFALADDDLGPLRVWLEERRGKKVELHVPQRGEKKRLLSLAARNAASSFATRRNRREDEEQALARLRDVLRLSRLPRRIECFDVSHVQGSDPVASMVVFEDGSADKSSYRSFKIRGLRSDASAPNRSMRQNDDFESMYEVLLRRLRRALEAEEKEGEDSWALPDLLVIDGGKGQLGKVLAAMQDLGIETGAEGVDIVALAKERRDQVLPTRDGLDKLASFKQSADTRAADGAAPGATRADYEIQRKGDAQVRVRPERVFVPGARDAIALAPGSSELYLLTRIRDEAHRFAITHHRKARGKRATKSSLDDIPGVGPTTKKALIAHFGKVSAIKSADEQALAKVRGVGPNLARTIRAYYDD